jgi:hypothetical protein
MVPENTAQAAGTVKIRLRLFKISKHSSSSDVGLIQFEFYWISMVPGRNLEKFLQRQYFSYFPSTGSSTSSVVITRLIQELN